MVDDEVKGDDLVLVAGKERKERTKIVVPTMTGFVLISENQIPPQLRNWFDGHKAQWEYVDIIKKYVEGGPWRQVPQWIQPLFEAAHCPAAPREQVVALVVANTLIERPELALNRQNVGYMLHRLDQSGKRTVTEALVARGGLDGLVEDLRAIAARGYQLLPLGRLESVLDSLAGYPRSKYPPEAVAEHVIKDQDAPAPRAGELVGAPSAAPTESLADLARAEDVRPYRDMADRIRAAEPPVRVYVGQNLFSLLVTPEGTLRPETLEVLSDLRGNIFKRFGFVLPTIKFRASAAWEPTLAPNAFRIELLNQTKDDADAAPITARAPEGAVKLLLDELARRLVGRRTWWITADYVDGRLERSEKIKAWLLGRYTLTDLKTLLRGVIVPTQAELKAYETEGVDGALRLVFPGQSLRKLDWLLASLVFWSQAYDPLDVAQLVQALQNTQAARLAPVRMSSPDRTTAMVLDGIKALKQRNFPRAEERFREALATNRVGAIAAFAPAYASRAMSMKDELGELTGACVPFERPGQLNKRKSVAGESRFEIEDFLARHQDELAEPDRVRLEYCLLEYYAANIFPSHIRTSLDKLSRYSGQLEPNQKYALGYWTLELNGQSPEPPSDKAAETWLSSAFQEWKETQKGEASAGEAIVELWNRYGGKLRPRWYMDMLQRLGKLGPKSFDVAYLLGDKLSGGGNMADVDKALSWLARARDRIDGPAVREADRPRLTALVDYAVAKADYEKARVSDEKTSEEMAQEATNLLIALIQRLKKGGVIADKNWPGASAYTTLIDTYLFRNKIKDAAEAFSASRQDGLSESADLLPLRFSLLLAAGKGRTDEALGLAQSALEMPDFSRADALFLVALSQLITRQPNAEDVARDFLKSGHEYRDYIRLMLYWYLAQQNKVDEAKSLLNERWLEINPASCPARLALGDPQVWRERLIGYYMGKVTGDKIFTPLDSPEAFKDSGLDRTGLTRYGMRCEAYFYDALLQNVTGEPASRLKRYEQALDKVLKVGHGDQYEYLMARYLRDVPR